MGSPNLKTSVPSILTGVGTPPTSGTASSGSAIPGLDLQGILQAKTAYQQALAQINQQRQSAMTQYGYLADIDPNTGTLTNMRVDPNNPNGLFEQMLNSHAAASQSAEYAAEGRGLGHGGLAAQGIMADKRAFGADSSQLGQNLMGQLEGLQTQQTGAENQMNDAIYQAQLAAAEQAILSQAFDTPDSSNVDIPPYDTGAGQGAGTTTPTTKTILPTATKPLTRAQEQAIVAKATAAGQPTSEHGLGQTIVPPAQKKPAPANAYLTNKNKKG